MQSASQRGPHEGHRNTVGNRLMMHEHQKCKADNQQCTEAQLSNVGYSGVHLSILLDFVMNNKCMECKRKITHKQQLFVQLHKGV